MRIALVATHEHKTLRQSGVSMSPARIQPMGANRGEQNF